jgi:hypothetical protein
MMKATNFAETKFPQQIHHALETSSVQCFSQRERKFVEPLPIWESWLEA